MSSTRHSPSSLCTCKFFFSMSKFNLRSSYSTNLTYMSSSDLFVNCVYCKSISLDLTSSQIWQHHLSSTEPSRPMVVNMLCVRKGDGITKKKFNRIFIGPVKFQDVNKKLRSTSSHVFIKRSHGTDFVVSRHPTRHSSRIRTGGRTLRTQYSSPRHQEMGGELRWTVCKR